MRHPPLHGQCALTVGPGSSLAGRPYTAIRGRPGLCDPSERERLSLVALRAPFSLGDRVVLLAVNAPALAILCALYTALLAGTHVAVGRRVRLPAIDTGLTAFE